MGGDAFLQEKSGEEPSKAGLTQLAAADVLPGPTFGRQQSGFGQSNNLKVASNLGQQSGDGPALSRWKDVPQPAPSTVDLSKPVEQRTEVLPTERRFEAPRIVNGVMELSYNDLDFEKKLMSTDKFDTIKIKDLPAGVSIQHWVDEGGYFFYFKGGERGDWIHYPPNARKMVVGAGALDLYDERLRVNDQFADAHHGGFKSLQRETEVLSYLANMSTYSDRTLAIQANSLKTSAEWSTNPYFKIFLADVMSAQVMKPMVRQLQDKQMPNVFDREAIAKLEYANTALQIAERDSKNSLGEWPLRPVVTPLGHRQPDPYKFFVGSMTQSRQRMGKVNELRMSIQGNRVPKFDVPTRRMD